MKLVLAMCFVVYGIVSSEFCDHDNDCTLTTCIDGMRANCYEHSGAHVCTCQPKDDHFLASYNCTQSKQCWGLFDPCHGKAQWHCLDSKCRCVELD